MTKMEIRPNPERYIDQNGIKIINKDYPVINTPYPNLGIVKDEEDRKRKMDALEKQDKKPIDDEIAKRQPDLRPDEWELLYWYGRLTDNDRERVRNGVRKMSTRK